MYLNLTVIVYVVENFKGKKNKLIYFPLFLFIMSLQLIHIEMNRWDLGSIISKHLNIL